MGRTSNCLEGDEMLYTQRDLLKIMEEYNTMNRRKIKENFKTIKKVHNFQNRDINKEMGYEIQQVNGWFNKANPVVPLFEDALKISVHFNFDIREFLY